MLVAAGNIPVLSCDEEELNEDADLVEVDIVAAGAAAAGGGGGGGKGSVEGGGLQSEEPNSLFPQLLPAKELLLLLSCRLSRFCGILRALLGRGGSISSSKATNFVVGDDLKPGAPDTRPPSAPGAGGGGCKVQLLVLTNLSSGTATCGEKPPSSWALD